MKNIRKKERKNEYLKSLIEILRGSNFVRDKGQSVGRKKQKIYKSWYSLLMAHGSCLLSAIVNRKSPEAHSELTLTVDMISEECDRIVFTMKSVNRCRSTSMSFVVTSGV